jgi:hypothetical protein
MEKVPFLSLLMKLEVWLSSALFEPAVWVQHAFDVPIL